MVHCTSEDWFVNRGQVYAGPLANGDVVAVIINWGETDIENFEFNLREIGITGTVIARDMWEHADMGEYTGTFKVGRIPPYGNYALRFRQK